MDQETRKWILIVILLLIGVGVATSGAILVACAGADKPSISITAPVKGSQFNAGAEITVQATATDPQGIARVEFAVDGVIIGEQKFSSPQNAAAVIYTWKSGAVGAHTFSMRAFNRNNAASDPATVAINIIAQAIATPTPVARATPTVSATTAPAPCIHTAAFVADISIPDGTMMAANQTFNKIWRVMNTGSCPWDPSDQFVFVSGEAMTNLGYIGAPYTAPGATTDLVIALTAPATPGPHAGRWHLKARDGTFFGPMLDVRINVPNPAPPPICAGNPSIASFSASAYSITPHSAVTLNWGAVSNASGARIDPGIGAITAPGSFVVVVDTPTTFVLTARCNANSATAQVTVNVVAPTPLPPTRVPPTPGQPTPIPPTPAPPRRDINGIWIAGESELELGEAIGCATECGISGRLIKAMMPAPEIHAVRGTLHTTTGAVTWSVAIPGGQSFNGTVSADSRTMSGTFGGAAMTFVKK